MRRPRRRRRRWVLVLAGALLLAGVVGLTQLLKGSPVVDAQPCRVTVGAASFTMDREQAVNATTIAAGGVRLGLPDHAVTIALATALQESRLHNLSYGDRDSVGLFQQRPSQGWGTREQILSTGYATQAFYSRLTHLPGWETLPVTDAAQAVQHSAAPQAYAQWEPEARLLARTLTGEVPAGLTCRRSATADVAPAASLAAALQAELGAPGLDVPVTPARGWTLAAWLVSHAQAYRLGSITFADRAWSAVTGTWQNAAQPTDRVHTTG